MEEIERKSMAAEKEKARQKYARLKIKKLASLKDDHGNPDRVNALKIKQNEWTARSRQKNRMQLEAIPDKNGSRT
jgi:hypothetical protein